MNRLKLALPPASVRSRLAVALMLALGAQTVTYEVSAQAPNTAAWATTQTRVAATGNAAFGGLAADQESVSITVTLKLRSKDVLDSFIRELHRPGSPAYHQFLSSAQTTATFAPTEQQAQAVVDYLRQQGYTNVRIAPNRMLVTADGTVGNARSAFRTQIGHFSRDGRAGIANILDVQVPTALSDTVDRVLGLQTLDHAQTLSWHGRMQPVATSNPRPGYHIVTSPDGNPNAHGYYPQEFATVYDAGSAAAATNTTAAIIGWGSMANSVNDLAQMESGQGLAAVPTQVVILGGDNGDDSGQGEWGMDAQAIVGISGGVQKLIFYTAGGAEDQGLMLQTINRVVSDNAARVTNMSWGWPGCEDSSTGWADSAFELGIAQGQTFSAASGDNGAYSCGASSNGSYGTTLGVGYPASSPYVVTVGGTTLNTSTADGYISESSWAYSGGGISAHEAKPTWQSAVSGSYRQLPDLAFDADWTNTPIVAYFTASSGSGIPSSGYYTNGGTSLASPLFVGAWARLETANSNALGFAPPSLYAYASTFPFHDVTTGSNGHYAAAAGRDDATGWGSFDIQAAKAFIAANPGFISGGSGGATHLGMTWTSFFPANTAGLVHVGNDSTTNPYSGDTATGTALPIMCVSVGSNALPAGITTDYYDGWTGGTVAFTGATPGSQLTSRAVADGKCASAFGSGWRMAEFHDGGGGWSYWSYGKTPGGLGRFWVAINDQPANPWNTTTGKAMTWTGRTSTVIHVGRDSTTNPYNGDTPPSASLPILCIDVTGSALPAGITTDSSDGWASGNLAFTGAVQGSQLTSRTVADGKCSATFGSGWRMAEFHDGGGGWSYWGYGAIPAGTTRFWTAINDQPANPWN